MSDKSCKPFIVIVDDDPDDIEMLSSSLERKGLKVLCFLSGDKAMQYLKTCCMAFTLPALIILDYNIPKKNGEEILYWLKNNTETSPIPVVIYSTTITPANQTSLIKMGAAQCLVKPGKDSIIEEHAELFRNMAIS